MSPVDDTPEALPDDATEAEKAAQAEAAGERQVRVDAAAALAQGQIGEEKTTPSVRRQRLRQNQDYFSEKLSDLIRYIGFGLVAASFSLLSRSTDFSQKLTDRVDNLLALSALLGCLVIVADALQLLGGWWSNGLAARNAQADYKLVGLAKVVRVFQTSLFYAKQILAGLGCALFILAMASSVSVPSLTE